MSLSIDELRIGAVVRLASGSPKMVVTGFGPSPAPGRQPHFTRVEVLVWNERLGLIRTLLDPKVLVWPRSAPPAHDAPDDEPGDGDPGD